MPEAFTRVIHYVFMWYLERVVNTRCPVCYREGEACDTLLVHSRRSMAAARKLVSDMLQVI